MTYEEFDKRCDELENAPLPERKTFFADVLAGETEKTDVRMMAYFRYALLFYREGDFLAAREISGTVHHRLQKLPVPPGDHRLLQPRRLGGLLCAGVRTVPLLHS